MKTGMETTAFDDCVAWAKTTSISSKELSCDEGEFYRAKTVSQKTHLLFLPAKPPSCAITVTCVSQILNEEAARRCCTGETLNELVVGDTVLGERVGVLATGDIEVGLQVGTSVGDIEVGDSVDGAIDVGEHEDGECEVGKSDVGENVNGDRVEGEHDEGLWVAGDKVEGDKVVGVLVGMCVYGCPEVGWMVGLYIDERRYIN
eukprot:jgi/Bigna1/142268/aug1.68_g16976